MSLLDSIQTAIILGNVQGGSSVSSNTAAVLQEQNFIPAQGELVVEYDTGLIKIGDGVTPYNGLSYANIPAEDAEAILDVTRHVDQLTTRPVNYTPGNIVVFSNDGNLEDSGITPDEYVSQTNVTDLVQDEYTTLILNCGNIPL